MLKTSRLSKLSAVRGTVTRTSDVRPELLRGDFRCEKCGLTAAGIDQQFAYTKPTLCRNPRCLNTTSFKLDYESSTFADFQKCRVQETSGEIPAGSMPRSVDVVLRGEIVEKAKAGDTCVFTGSLVVIPDSGGLSRSGEAVTGSKKTGDTGSGVSGIKKFGVRELTYKTVFIATNVVSEEIFQAMQNGNSVRPEDMIGSSLNSGYVEDEASEGVRTKMRKQKTANCKLRTAVTLLVGATLPSSWHITPETLAPYLVCKAQQRTTPFSRRTCCVLQGRQKSTHCNTNFGRSYLDTRVTKPATCS